MTKSGKLEILGLGKSTVDYLTVVPRMPKLDERIEMVTYDKQGGGPVSQAIVTAARLGANVGYIGKVGKEESGNFIVSEYKKEGVDISRLLFENGQSPFSFIMIDQRTGKRTIVTNYGNLEVSPSELDVDYIKSCSLLHLDGNHLKAAVRAAKIARDEGIPVSIDLGNYKSEFMELIKLTDILIPSKSAAYAVTGEKEPEKAVEKLLDFDAKIVGVTLGNRGCICRTKDEVIRYPAFKVKAVDTTGAGDVFHGAFVYGYVKGWGLRKIIEFSSAVAAMKCMKLGGRAGIPRLNEVKNFLKEREKTL